MQPAPNLLPNRNSGRSHAVDPDGYVYDDLKPLARTCLEADISVLLRGHPGVGKSTMAAELAADMGLTMEDIRLAQREPAEIAGVYFPSADRTELALLPPPWVRRACAEPTVVFLDQINAAVTRLHQAAAYQIVLERRVGPFCFHPLRLYDRVDPAKIVENGQRIDFTQGERAEPSFAYAAITAVGRFVAEHDARWQPQWADNLVRFLRSPGLDIEYAFILLRDLKARSHAVENLKPDPSYRALCGEIVALYAAAFA